MIANLVVLANMGLYTDWFFNQLPQYYRENDTYKDGNGEGLLQRYLRVYSQDLEEDFIPFFEGMINQLNPITCDEKFLSHIAYSLGNPPDLFNEVDKYRKFLKIISKIYQIKGSYCSYQVIFQWFGYFNMAIYEPFLSGVRYDEDFLYDTPGVNYDSICPPCKPYYIAVMPPESPCLPLPDSGVFTWDLNEFITPETLEKIICLIEPINMNLKKVIPLLSVCETFKANWTGKLDISQKVYPQYDEGIKYDEESIFYDQVEIIPVINLNLTELNPNAYTLIAKNLGEANRPIDFFVFKYQGVIVKTLPIQGEVISPTEVKFTAEIPLGQQNGPYDYFELASSLGGTFMEKAIDLPVQTEDLEITFNLIVDVCG
jgi:hypothetical protein